MVGPPVRRAAVVLGWLGIPLMRSDALERGTMSTQALSVGGKADLRQTKGLRELEHLREDMGWIGIAVVNAGDDDLAPAAPAGRRSHRHDRATILRQTTEGGFLLPVDGAGPHGFRCLAAFPCAPIVPAASNHAGAEALRSLKGPVL